MSKLILNIFLFIFTTSTLYSQDVFNNKEVLMSKNYQGLVNRIVKIYNSDIVIVLKKDYKTKNAKVSCTDYNTILYNPRFFKNLNNDSNSLSWQEIGVLLHEIGHIVNLDCYRDISMKVKEIEADIFLGKIMHYLGASIDQSILCVQNVKEDALHLSKIERINNIRKGWRLYKPTDIKIEKELISARKYFVDGNFKKAQNIYEKYQNSLGLKDINNLAALYYYNFFSDNRTENLKRAFKLYEKSAKKGSVYGQNNLGFFYTEGLGCKQDFSKGFYWYLKAANNDLAEAQINLASLYEDGKGVRIDLKKAEYYYKKAANQNNSAAEYMLGVFYSNQKKYLQSFKWFEKSARKNFPIAQFVLSEMYKKGIGVKKNIIKANYWSNKFENNIAKNIKLLINLIK